MRRIIAFTVTVAVAMVASAAFRPPSVPIVSCDPFFSIWSPSEDPTDSDTEIWFGAKQPIRILVELDGTTYRIMGGKAALEPKRRGEDVPALRCIGCEVRALTSVFAFSDGAGHSVSLECMTAKFTDELDVFSRPVAYFTVKASGAKSVRVNASISPSLATNDDRDWTPHDLWLMERREAEIAGMKAYSLGKRRQKALSMCGDRVRCDWGWAWIVNPESEGAETHFIVAYDDVASVEFLGGTLNAWWRRDGNAFDDMLAEAWRDYVRCREKANAFDAAFRSRAAKAGGVKYAALAALAYRQSFAACKLVCGRDGQPLYFSKENTSNGSMGTVDVFYPQMPLLLLESPTLARATLEPIMIYASSGRWPYDYAPHDVGTYPWGNGQAYNFNPSLTADRQTKDDTARMPVEECGNMLICLCALAERTGDCSLAGKYWDDATKWVRYLEKFGFDPGNQLCTDDFAGHLAHNANLSIKSIMAFSSYARLAERLGKADAAVKYRNLAKSCVPKWMEAAEGGAHGGYRLAFDQPDTWSLKYNLVWDRLLGFGLFPAEVADREVKVYRRVTRPFGIPLDSRSEYGKVDWEFWAAALTGRRADMDFITDVIYRYADETPDRNPFPDWHWTNNSRVRGFLGRSVIGGVFMPMLAFEWKGVSK